MENGRGEGDAAEMSVAESVAERKDERKRSRTIEGKCDSHINNGMRGCWSGVAHNLGLPSPSSSSPRNDGAGSAVT